MLQWMGGSRRKVTTSRNSTQKRQKQYFEQRRRKQQYQQTDAESYSDGNNTYSQQSKNNKSLDVLNLLNLSAVSKEPNFCCPQENIEGITLTPNHQTLQCPRTVQTNEVTQMSPPRIKEESPSCALVDSVCPKNLPFGAPESLKQKLKGNWNNLNLLKMPTEHQISVIDILGDDGPSSNFEESTRHEAHVAFSIQGLGKVDAETPVHSPERPGRNFVYGEYFPPKERIKAHSSFKNLTSRPDNIEHELDTMMRDIGVPLYRGPVEPSFRSRSNEDLFSSPKPNLLPSKKLSPVLDYDTSEDIFEDEELFGKQRRKNIWNASSSFPTYGIIDQEEYGLPCKNELDQMDSGSIHYAHRNYEHQDFSFESHQWKKSANIISPFEINDTDSPSLYPKHHITQHFEGPSAPNIKCNYSMGTRDYCFGDCNKQTHHGFYASDDTKESLSLPSEESFFSAAVRDDLLEKSRSCHGINHKNTLETKFSNRDIFGNGRFCSNKNVPQHRGNAGGLRIRNLPAHLKNHGFSQDQYNLSEEILGSNLYTVASPQPQLHFDQKCRGFPAEPRIVFPTSRTDVPDLFQTSRIQCRYFDLQRDIPEVSNVSSYVEDQCSDTTKEPRCRTPEVTESTNASKPLEHAEETSSCPEVPIQGCGDPNKSQSD